MAQHGDELFAQLRRRLGVRQRRLAAIQLVLVVEMGADQFGEQFEHRLRLAVFDGGRLRVDRAQGAEEGPTVLDRHRDIALQAVHPRGVMVAIGLVLRGVAEHDRLAMAANLVAERGLEHQFAANAQAERDLVADGAGDPAIIGDASDGGEAHAGGPARDLEDLRNDVQAADRGHVVGDRGGHLYPDCCGACPRPRWPVPAGTRIAILPLTIACRRRGARRPDDALYRGQKKGRRNVAPP